MHVLLDLRWMKPGYTGGIETQSRAFLKTLLDLDYSNQYTILIPSEARFDFDLGGHRNFTFINCDGPAYFFNRLAEKLGMRRLDRQKISVAGYIIQCDVAISMTGYTHPDLMELPTLLVVPDIQHEFFPQYFVPQELANRERAFNTSIENAHMICAVSAFTRQTLIDKLHIPAEKIVVAPLAVDPQIAQAIPLEAQARTLQKYGLTPGYLFYPALTWPHKNHINLIHAMRLLRDQYNMQLVLVCTGTAKEAQAEIQTAIQHYELTDRVHFLGFIPLDDLSSLYRNASALVLPSMFEGFGMPVLEAMACSCPVVCSNTTALPEVGGDAALYFNPEDPAEIAQALHRLLSNPAIRETLILTGRQRVQRYSWKRFTLQVLQQAYRTVNGSHPSQAVPKTDDWEAAEWQAILFPNQAAGAPNKVKCKFWVNLTSAHRNLALRWMHTSAEAGRQHQTVKSGWFGLSAFIISPRAVFISLIFPALRDFFRRIRSGDHV
ncbi:MAG: glycosyltransferase family 1 protein [Anaerolineales bacterium]|nr:glycosyltransferase family 1 protein [Anaerolineales bacterium]